MAKGLIPKNIEEALELVPETMPIAGGTDLMVRYKAPQGVLPKNDRPFLFLAHLAELSGIKRDGDILRIGATTTLSVIENHNDTPSDLKKAISQMAAPNIRNIATIGGNVMNASPAGDTLPSLIARDAKAFLRSKDGERSMPIAELVNGPCTTCIAHGEILTHIKIPLKPFNHIFYRKLGTRKSMSLSKVSMVLMADIKDNKVEDIRIALGAVAPVVVRSLEAEEAIMEGRNIADILNIYIPLIRPITDQRSTADYRKKTALRLLESEIERLYVHIG